MRTTRACWAGLVLLLATPILGDPARAQPSPAATGRIAGRVVDPSGVPIEYASVGLVALQRGAPTDEHGRFRIDQVPAGPVALRVLMTGFHEARRTLEVVAGRTTEVEFVLEPSVFDIPVIEVRASSKQIEHERSETSHRIGGEELRDLPVQNYIEAVGLTSGTVLRSGQLSVRGGRPNETRARIAGIEASDPLGGRNAEIANLAIEGIEVLTGGLEAEYGGALSGVIDVTTREGPDSLIGNLRWDTDRFGDPTKTFDRYDRFTLGVGGPTPFPNLTWFGTYEGTFTDTHLRSTVSRTRRSLFDFIELADRQSNRVNTALKLAYRASRRDKITFEVIRNHALATPYEHMWSRRGFVQVTTDTLRGPEGGETYLPRYGSWSGTAVDSTYQAVNMPDHLPTLDDRYRQLTAVWTHQRSALSVWTTRLGAVAFDTRFAVGQKPPWEYQVQSPFYWSGNTGVGTENNPYFATHGDFPRYLERRSTTATLKSDFATQRWERHWMKTGLEARYHRVQNLNLGLPNQETDGLPGGTRSDFWNEQPELSAYLQDRWEFEGLVLNLGVRYDLFTPGAQITDAELASGRRYKQQVSPRVGIAYPISDRDALSFAYGWTFQTPGREMLFENRGLNASVPIRGNPDLDAQTDISYQAGLQHLFSRDLSGQFVVFFRDIFGLITTRPTRDPFGNPVAVFANGDYASARGFEASLAKRFSRRFSANLNYTYSLATGVASDPAQALQFINGNRLFLAISERPLRWDQRHTLSFSSTLRHPDRWGLRLLWTYGSGFPFTPAFRNDRRADPRLEHSRRLPSHSNLTLVGDKYFRLWGQDLTLFVDARNLLDAVNVAELSPNAAGGQNPYLNLAGDDYTLYYTETGRLGGAYLQDQNGDGVLDWVPVHDPRVFEEGRHVRLGLALDF